MNTFLFVSIFLFNIVCRQSHTGSASNVYNPSVPTTWPAYGPFINFARPVLKRLKMIIYIYC